MLLKNEKSRRVDESHSVCVGRYSCKPTSNSVLLNLCRPSSGLIGLQLEVLFSVILKAFQYWRNNKEISMAKNTIKYVSIGVNHLQGGLGTNQTMIDDDDDDDDDDDELYLTTLTLLPLIG